MVGAVEGVRGRLVDRHGDGLGGGIVYEAAVDGEGLSLHRGWPFGASVAGHLGISLEHCNSSNAEIV
jgi:hypothetical protein